LFKKLVFPILRMVINANKYTLYSTKNFRKFRPCQFCCIASWSFKVT